MSDFELVYESNGQKIGDGMRVTRVSQDGQRLEVLVDDKTEKFSPIIAVLKEDVPDPVEPDPDPIPDPEPTPDPVPTPDPTPANVQNAGELASALSSAIGGETFVLAPGDYGDCPSIPSGVTLQAADPAKMPVLNQLMLAGVDGVSLSGLHLKYSLQDGGNHGLTANRFAVENCNDITLDGLIIEGDRLPSGNANGRGLKINTSARVSLLNSEIFAFWSGISAHTMNDLTISGCNIHSMLSDGIKLGRINGALISLNYIHDFEHDPATGNHPDMVQIMRSSSDGCTGLKFHDNLFDMNKSGDAEIWAQTLTANQDKADLDNPAHQLHDIEYLRNVVIANQQHACTMVGVASGVFADNRLAAIPRPSAANAGAAIPKMRISGSPSITMAGNIGPGVINLNGQPVSGNSPDTPLDYLAERAAARRDKRWSHFFA